MLFRKVDILIAIAPLQPRTVIKTATQFGNRLCKTRDWKVCIAIIAVKYAPEKSPICMKVPMGFYLI